LSPPSSINPLRTPVSRFIVAVVLALINLIKFFPEVLPITTAESVFVSIPLILIPI
jgi:hypothetical protein